MALSIDGGGPREATPRRAGTHRHPGSPWVPTAAGVGLGAVVGLLAGWAVLAVLLAAHLSA